MTGRLFRERAFWRRGYDGAWNTVPTVAPAAGASAGRARPGRRGGRTPGSAAGWSPRTSPVSRNVGIVIILLLAAATYGFVQAQDLPRWVTAEAKLAPTPLSFTHSAPGYCEPGSGGQVALSAILRNDGEGWYAIDDADHRPVNVARVETTTHGVRVHYTFEADRIHTVSVDPDEAFALAGIGAGASVGMAALDIVLVGQRFGHPMKLSPLKVTTQRWPMSNLWVRGTFEGACSGQGV